MVEPVITPITQALQEGALTRAQLKAFMKRSNGPAFIRLIFWLATLVATGTLVWMSLGTWWLLPAMFMHGIVLVHHFSLQHECIHYTAFRTRRLNDLAGTICGIVIMLPFKFFRYEHCDHHTYTQIKGDDPELIELPSSIGKYLEYISSVPYWKTKVNELTRHTLGHLTAEEKRFIPSVEHGNVFLEARIMVAGYGCVLAAMVVFDWWAPLWFWIVPVLLGEPVMRAVRMTEHVGRPMVEHMRENTRTNLVSWPARFLCWNMNYHAEHHYAASVPFHALPRLHEKLKDHIHVEPGGYLGAHRDIIARILSARSGKDGHPVRPETP